MILNELSKGPGGILRRYQLLATADGEREKREKKKYGIKLANKKMYPKARLGKVKVLATEETMLTNEEIEPLMNAALEEKPQEFTSLFDELMRNVVSQKVADLKAQVAQTLLVDPEDIDDEAVNEEDDPPKDPSDDEEEELLPGEEDLEGDEDGEEETDGAEDDVEVVDGDEDEEGEEVAEGKSKDSDMGRQKEDKFRKRDSARVTKKAACKEEE